MNVLWHSTGFLSGLSVFSPTPPLPPPSSVCLPVRVTMVDKNKAVVCCLLATSAIMLSEKKKTKHTMWSKKWYLKRNTSYDAHLATAPQHIPTQHDMLPQHLVCKYELNCEYSDTSANEDNSFRDHTR